MIQRSALSVLLTLTFVISGPASALAHPNPFPHSHTLTKGGPQTSHTIKKSAPNANRPLLRQTETKIIPQQTAKDLKRKPLPTSVHTNRTAAPPSN